MKALQWSMTIPAEKETAFIKWFKEIAGPAFAKFVASKHELYKVENNNIVGRQLTEEQRFIERVYFEDNFSIPDYFITVKKDPEAGNLSRMYENEFQAHDLELRIINSIAD